MTNRTEDPLYYFFDRFAEASGLECAVFKSTTWTYRDLLEEISRDSQALAEYGISVGHVVGITGQFHLRHLSLFFASRACNSRGPLGLAGYWLRGFASSLDSTIGAKGRWAHRLQFGICRWEEGNSAQYAQTSRQVPDAQKGI